MLTRFENLYKNKMALPSQVNQIKTQLNQIEKKKIELQYAKRTLLQNLSLITKTAVNEIAEMQLANLVVNPSDNRRPELEVFNLQKNSNSAQVDLIRAKNKPKLNLFATGGYGRPGLNMLSPDFQFYYMGGVKATLPLSGFYTVKNDLQNIELQNIMVDRQLDTWQQGMDIQLNQAKNDAAKYEALLLLDEKDIEWKKQIAQTGKAQLQENTILVDIYTKQLNDLEEARINKSLHEIQLLQTKINYQFITGNL